MTWIELKPQKGKGSQFAIQIQIIISSLSQMVKSAIWNNFDCWGVRNTPSPSLPTLYCKWFWKTVEACAYFLKQNMWKMLSWTISMESIVVIVWIYLILFQKKLWTCSPPCSAEPALGVKTEVKASYTWLWVWDILTLSNRLVCALCVRTHWNAHLPRFCQTATSSSSTSSLSVLQTFSLLVIFWVFNLVQDKQKEDGRRFLTLCLCCALYNLLWWRT